MPPGRSDALAGIRSYRVLLPAGYVSEPRRRYPVLYLLHGKGGDQDDWADKTRLAERLGGAGLLVVMPDGDDGWYIDGAAEASGYETQIVGELIPHVDSRYRTIARRDGRAVPGLSMGGYYEHHEYPGGTPGSTGTPAFPTSSGSS